MPYSALAIANYFIARAKAKGASISPMKLQKLIYFAHGWALALTGEALIKDKVQAWAYGPVIPSVYHEFKDFGNEPIDRPATEFDTGFEENVPDVPKSDSSTLELLDKVWEVYSGYTAVQLSNATHQPGTPWQKVWDSGGKDEKHTIIPNDIIREHFKAKLK